MEAPTIRIGIGGWTYEPWRGVFYPDDLPHKRELEFAARTFGAIEINATFYGRQSPKSWENWAKSVPDGFQFSVKGSRYVVTRPKLPTRAKGSAISWRKASLRWATSSGRSCGCWRRGGNSNVTTSQHF
ncbi:MAG: DUF72 domain-containing protein [Sphingomicrobium sp.]